MEKLDAYRPSLPHVVTVLMEQYNLSPLLPHREEVFALLFPPPSILSSSNKQMTCKIPIPLLVPWVESGLRTSIQCWFSLELPYCSNSIFHSNKLYFPLILPHVWKFFSNLRIDNDMWYCSCGSFSKPTQPTNHEK